MCMYTYIMIHIFMYVMDFHSVGSKGEVSAEPTLPDEEEEEDTEEEAVDPSAAPAFLAVSEMGYTPKRRC